MGDRDAIPLFCRLRQAIQDIAEGPRPGLERERGFPSYTGTCHTPDPQYQISGFSLTGPLRDEPDG